MQQQTQERIASGIIALAGLVTLSLPLFITIEGGALISLLFTGISLTILGLVQLFVRNSLPSILSVLVAIWGMASAFLFDMSNSAMISLLVTAGVTFFASLWSGFEASELEDQSRTFAH